MKRIALISLVTIMVGCTAQRPLTLTVSRIDTVGGKVQVSAYSPSYRTYVATFDTLPADLRRRAVITAQSTGSRRPNVFKRVKR